MSSPYDLTEIPPLIGRRIGPYRIVGEAGHGGMGTVFLAERADDQFRQRVALKVMRPGWEDDGGAVQRFMAERRILATLEHPNIARLLDGGITDEGVPWFAMEFVDGIPLDRFADEHRLSIRDRIQLFLPALSAAQFAHQNLVVHRDLKPSNILATADGQVKVLDFGIARILESTASRAEPRTATGSRFLTPEYASPEQLRGEPVSTTSDVYSLGVVFYQLLAGRRPPASGGKTLTEWERAVLDAGAVAPSNAISLAQVEATAAARSTTPDRLRRALRGDLDAIALKALRPEPERRYQSADHLALDLRHYLAGETVSARSDTWRYRASTFIRRYRWAVAAALVFFLTVVGFATVATVQARRIAQERNTAQEVATFLQDLFLSPDPYQGAGRNVLARDILDSGAARIGQLSGQPVVQADLMSQMSIAYYGLGEYARSRDLMARVVAFWRRRRDGLTGGRLSVALLQLGSAQRMLGDYVGAEATFREGIEVERLRPPPAWTAHRELLGSVLRARGRLAEADSILRDAVAENRRGIDSVRLANSLRSLGHVVLERGRPAEAESLYRETLALHRRIFKADNPEVATGQVNIANALRDQHRLAEAESLYVASIAMGGRLLGQQHSDVALMQADYAKLLGMKGDTLAAVTRYRQAIGVLENQGTLSVQRSMILLDFGELLAGSGSRTEARTVLEEAGQGLERVRPSEDSLVIRNRRLLASLH